MPYELPTADQFRTRFPEFAEEEDARLDALILEASGQVDTSWVEADYQPAIMYLAAHLLAGDNAAAEESESGGSGDGNISSENFGPLSVSYDNSSSNSDSQSGYTSTSYGRRYLALLKKNKPAILAI